MAATFPLAVILSAVDRVTGPIRAVQNTVGGFGKSLTKMGSTLTAGVTLPLAAFGGLAIKTGLDFERSFQRIGANTGATAAELAQLRAAVKALPPDLGMTRGIAVLEGLAAEGMNAAEAMQALVPTTQLAKASMLDGAEAASLMADTLDATGSSIADAQRLADLLVKSTHGSTKGVQDFTAALQAAGPAARNAGLSLEDQVAAVKAFAAAGVEGSTAGAALKAGITALIKPSGQAMEVLQRLNINKADVFDADGKLRSLGDTLSLLRERGADTSDFLSIFGNRAGQAFAAIDPANLQAVRAELENVSGAAAEGADKMSQGAAGAFERMTNSFTVLMDAIASSGLLDWIGKLAELVGQLLGWISQASPGFLKFATVILGVVAAVGPLLVFIGTLASGISAVAGAFGVIMPIVAGIAAFFTGTLVPAIGAVGAAILATPIGWLLAGIAAVIGIGYLLWKHWDKVMGFLKAAWMVFMTPVRLGLEWLMSKLPALSDLIPDWLKSFIGIETGEPPKNEATSDAVAAVAAGGRIENVTKSEAAVKVSFDNLPSGAKVSEVGNTGLDLDLLSGYAMGT